MNFGQNIKARRLELGISQKELASTIGYRSRSAIAKIEGGNNDIPLSKLEDFAQALDTTVEQLLLGFHLQRMPEANSLTDTNKSYRCGVIVLAGGRSTRNQQNTPNQFINVQGKPVFMYSVEAYQRHPLVDDIYLVCLRGWESVAHAYTKQYAVTKLREIVPAGETGLLSIRNGLDEAHKDGYKEDDILIIQETTRPFVSEETISKLISSCLANGSTVMYESLSDHLSFKKTDGETYEYINRYNLVSMQSPDAHQFFTLNAMFKTAALKQIPLKENCCGMLMYELGFPLTFCEGTHNNIKIVRQEDLAIFSALLKQRTD